MRSLTLTLFLLCALAAAPAAAQEAAPSTPEAVADAYLKATFAADWVKCASLLHPEALAQLKGALVPLLKMKEAAGVRETILRVKTAEELEALRGEAVYERLMQYLESDAEGYAEAVRSSSATILGSVAEGEGLAHVVYRVETKLAQTSLLKVDVMSLKRDGAAWRVALAGDLEQFASALAAQLEAESPAEPAPQPAPQPRPAPRRGRARRP